MQDVQPAVEFEYLVSEDDYADAFFTHWKYARKTSLAGRLSGVVIFSLILLAILLAAFRHPDAVSVSVAVLLSFIFVFFVAWFALRRHLLRRDYRKDVRFQPAFRIRITPDNVHFFGPAAETIYKPGAFVKAVETDKLLLLYVSTFTFNIIPKHGLTTEEKAGMNWLLNRELPVRQGPLRFPAAANT